LHELGRKRWEAFGSTVSITSLDMEVLAGYITEFTQNLNEIAACVIRRGGGGEPRLSVPTWYILPDG
jgi:hypothetical protein